jgi:hypothetical protein
MQRAAASLIASAATPAAEHLGGNKQTAFEKGVASIGVKYAGDQELVSYSDARTLAPVYEERHLRDVLKKKRPPAVARLDDEAVNGDGGAVVASRIVHQLGDDRFVSLLGAAVPAATEHDRGGDERKELR